jgi:hypothetical protein
MNALVEQLSQATTAEARATAVADASERVIPVGTFTRHAIKNSALVQDYWRPFKVDQQLLAPPWFEGAPAGYFHVVRSQREPEFRSEDLHWCGEAQGRG